MRKAIIVDIDGTLANCSHRLHYIQGENKDWTKFFCNIERDKPNEWCVEIVNSLEFHSDYIIIIVSGRPEILRQRTVDWLRKHEIYWDKIYLRKNGDYRPDYVVKKEIYEVEIQRKYEVLFVLEDRSGVVKMWRELGLTCLQCADGDY